MGLIHEYGLRWKASEVDWSARDVQLLGHGTWHGVTWAADFSAHRGVYSIYRSGELYYVGLTKRQGLGARLKQHLTGAGGGLVPEERKLRREDEFSWFGFDKLHNNRTYDDGLLRTRRLPLGRVVDPLESISDWEAVLILSALPAGNKKNQYPKGAVRWTQVKSSQAALLLEGLTSARKA